MKKLILTVLILGLWGTVESDCCDLTVDSTTNFIITSMTPPRALDDTFCVLTIYYVETVDVKLVERTVEVPCPNPTYGMGCLVIHWGTKKVIEPVLKKTIIREISMPCTEIKKNISLQVSFGLLNVAPIIDTLFENDDYYEGAIDTILIDTSDSRLRLNEITW